jgi:tRNA G18 (ribose-2'-O)-methylase SpoU
MLENIIDFRDSLLKSKDISLSDNDIIIKRYDSVKEKITKFPLVIILDNLRSAFNVGSIIRSSECLGVLEITLCGNTPGPENRKVVETSMGTVDYVDIIKYPSVHEAILSYRQQGFKIIALELTNNSLPLEKYQPASKVALLLGNESLGVAEETLAMCDKIIEINMHGVKNSLNVSNTAAIAIHNISKKMEKIK